MPQRDPETGKFVSGGRSNASWNDRDVITGTLVSTIPAADLAGGTTQADVKNEDAEVIDFTDYLDSDEVFRTVRMDVTVVLSMPTTATAEGAAALGYVLTDDYTNASPTGNFPTTLGGGKTHESGIVDVSNVTTDRGDHIGAGQLAASNSSTDSVNGTGAGSDWDRDRWSREFAAGTGPKFDEDDELVAPHRFAVDNVSDYSVAGHIIIRLEGVIDRV